MTYQVELVGLFAPSEDKLAGVEAYIGCTSDKQFHMVRFQSLEEGVLCQNAFKRLHLSSPLLIGVVTSEVSGKSWPHRITNEV